VAGGIEFDWDEANTRHLAADAVTPAEFEQVLNNDPLDLDYRWFLPFATASCGP